MAKDLIINNTVKVFDNALQLNTADLELLEAARKASEAAYAPYSRFYVGAAVKLANGAIITGNNQENAAYPSGLCAERVALFYASAQYPEQKITGIAITASSKKINLNKPVSPCGACRQVMAEYETKFDSPIRLIMCGHSGQVYVCESVSVLLPLMFTEKDLGK